MSSAGISRIGSSEVAGIGMASVDHQVAISRVSPMVAQAALDRPPGGSVNRHASSSNGPRIRPIQAALAGAVDSLVVTAMARFLQLKVGLYSPQGDFMTTRWPIGFASVYVRRFLRRR